jgi:CubicO group peptidase (beta-lactamase class C family)
MQRDGGQEVWDGAITEHLFRGAFRNAEESGTFELLRVPELPTARLRTLEGTYRWPDGKRIRIAHLSRVTDELLCYFDEATGEDQWLFPLNDSTFIAGPTFEQPLPERRRATFRQDVRGRTRLVWQRDEQPELNAERADLALDTGALSTEIRQFLDERDVPSASIAIVTRQGVAWASAFGFADRESSRVATLDTPYQIGSVTKVLTAALLLRLRDKGLLRFDDSLSRWLPPGVQLPPGATGESEITIRHLLTHSAGLPGDPVNRRDVDGVMQPYSVADLYAGLQATYLRSAPGREWFYSNLGYALLGHVIERVTGRSFEDALRGELLTPLGMNETSVRLTPETELRLAVHYWPEDTVRQRRPRWVFGEVAGFGGLTSTTDDLVKFVTFELGGTTGENPPLSSAAIAESQRPQYLFDGWRQAMGIGWWIRRDPQLGTILHHGGEVDGHSSYAAMSKTHGIGVIVLTNLGGSTATDLGEQLLRRVIAAARASAVPTRSEAFALFFDADWADAAWALDTVAAARPTDGVAWLRLGLARYRLNQFSAAVPAFERAATLDFLPQEAMYHLARIESIRGAADAAFAWLRRALDAGLSARQIGTTPEFAPLHTDPRWTTVAGPEVESHP